MSNKHTAAELLQELSSIQRIALAGDQGEVGVEAFDEIAQRLGYFAKTIAEALAAPAPIPETPEQFAERVKWFGTPHSTYSKADAPQVQEAGDKVEPVAWLVREGGAIWVEYSKPKGKSTPLYAQPPKGEAEHPLLGDESERCERMAGECGLLRDAALAVLIDARPSGPISGFSLVYDWRIKALAEALRASDHAHEDAPHVYTKSPESIQVDGDMHTAATEESDQEFAEQIERFNREGQQAAPSADRRDAERYRWLRAQNWHDSPLAVVTRPKESIKLGFDCPSSDRLDEAIDAAIEAGSKEHAGGKP